MLPTLKSTGGGTPWRNSCGGMVDRCKTNFNAIWETHGAVVCKINRVDIFCRLSTLNERDRQTDHE